ncbi:MAG: CFI-box-CTERM domain-containing protein, partial [Nitrosopumilus sp.]
PPVDEEPTCGAGTELVNGICQVVMDTEPEAKGGGCLIATAAYGTELAPQVQLLREIRDNTVMSTAYGAAFMTGFNQLYYSFSPTIADMERENPMFQKVVRAFITPMVSSLSIMTLAEDGSEFEVLGLGISVIALNLGMYIAAPALIGFKVHNHFKSRK